MVTDVCESPAEALLYAESMDARYGCQHDADALRSGSEWNDLDGKLMPLTTTCVGLFTLNWMRAHGLLDFDALYVTGSEVAATEEVSA